MANSRKRRGAKTQALTAEYLRERGWPYAEDAGSGRPGRDVLGTPGLAIEVKARRDLALPKWLRQASAHSENGGGLPIVIHRPDGFGPASIDDWPATLRLADLVLLLRQAGYGTPLAAQPREGRYPGESVPAPPPLVDRPELEQRYG